MQFRLCLAYLNIGMLLGLSFSLTACDSHHPESTKQQTKIAPERELQQTLESEPTEEIQGMGLTEIAGQATLPRAATRKQELKKPTGADLIYTGRYRARMPCTDPFAGCVRNEKEAEYIVNLLDDGSVYWVNTSFGRLSPEPNRHGTTKIEQMCKQVQWQVEVEKKELIIRCDAANVNFYYDIDQDQNLVMNLAKLKKADQGQNLLFFKEYPFPQKNYVFERIK